MFKSKFIGLEFTRYRHGELSPMVLNILPMIMLQRDPKGGIAAKRPPPHLMLFLAWWCWQLRIDLNYL